MKNTKLQNVINSKYFIPCLVIVINITFFILSNILLKPRFETLDDFTIMKIISKLDGTYSYYSVYIHPLLSFIIMLLYKTGININWYSIFLLILQFISFTVIGIILLNKNKKMGLLCYIIIISAYYSRILIIINYTSTAAITILAGIISLIYYNETNKKTNIIIGLILITVGTMLRWKSSIIVLPFYIIYVAYYTIKNKDFKLTKILMLIMSIIILIIISNNIVYKIDSIYKKYTDFNKTRTYFFDANVLDYNKNKEIFDKSEWTYTDWKMFYTYSFADDEFYTIERLNDLKQNINNNLDTFMNKILYSFKLSYSITIQQYLILFIGICSIVIISFVIKKNRGVILLYFIAYIAINFILCYTKPMYRVIVPLYTTTFIMMIYIMLNDIKYNKEIIRYILVSLTIIYSLINCFIIYSQNRFYDKERFSLIKDIISYTSLNKENAYIYPNVLGNISLAYSIYEKIPDDTFSNLRHMGDWDIYNKEYYLFKEKYNIKNPITDLYEKDNLYIISGDVYAANNQKYNNHIDTVIQYIKEHYNKNIEYKIVKEFSNSIKVYKLYDKNEVK